METGVQPLHSLSNLWSSGPQFMFPENNSSLKNDNCNFDSSSQKIRKRKKRSKKPFTSSKLKSSSSDDRVGDSLWHWDNIKYPSNSNSSVEFTSSSTNTSPAYTTTTTATSSSTSIASTTPQPQQFFINKNTNSERKFCLYLLHPLLPFSHYLILNGAWLFTEVFPIF